MDECEFRKKEIKPSTIREEDKQSIIDAAVAYTLNHAANRPQSTCAERVFRELESRGFKIERK